MTLSYFPDTDSLYISLTDKPSVESEELTPGFVFDFDAEGSIVGIDIDSNASTLVDLSKIEMDGLPLNDSTNRIN